jgi:enoyl-CoA hydratase/carnithine racemase
VASETVYRSDYEGIEVEREGRVGIVRWNRPDRMNAMNATMYREWIETYDAFNADPSIGAVVLTGNGRAYSAGADIGGFERTFTGGSEGAPPPPPAATHPPFAPWYTAEGKPIVGAINGVAVGIGFTSLLWLDVLVASTEARFSARFAAIGLTPELNSSWMLPRIVGLQNAKEMMLTGRIYSAEEAKSLGLVRHVVEPEQLLPTAIALASEIAANPEPTLRTIKRMIMEDLLTSDLSTIERRSTTNFAEARKTAEHREALLALREKRPPRYHDVEYMAELAEKVASGTS